jgi:hypothetical protein
VKPLALTRMRVTASGEHDINSGGPVGWVEPDLPEERRSSPQSQHDNKERSKIWPASSSDRRFES